jgi:Flp pilus assembly protein TadG
LKSDRGTVTAELAVALPSLVLLLGVVLAVGQLMLAQIGCIDGARAAARLAARGEPSGRVAAAVAAAAPPGATFVLGRGGGEVRVRVTASVRLPLPAVPAVAVVATAVAADETVFSGSALGGSALGGSTSGSVPGP